uniref:peptide-methionine (R)-S-oxide reductase n=2 Tax=Lepeophtheirus salmonis TaxID=72036 RepID=A0A0K2UFY2_LEPSM
MSFCSRWNKGEVYRDHFSSGKYVCSQCDNDLFSSESKFEHQTPWPAFYHPIRSDSLSKKQERKNAYKVSCGKCGNGLGHEFLNEGPKGNSRF